MFAIHAELLKSLLKDLVWTRKLECAKTMREVEEVLRGFALEEGWKIEELKWLSEK